MSIIKYWDKATDYYSGFTWNKDNILANGITDLYVDGSTNDDDLTGDGKVDLDLTGYTYDSNGDPVSFSSSDLGLVEIGGAIFEGGAALNSGTGNFNDFLGIQNTGTEGGFNADSSSTSNNQIKTSSNFTHTITLADIAITTDEFGNAYYEFLMDANENNSSLENAQISLDRFILFTADNADITTKANLFTQSIAYDMDGATSYNASFVPQGSGVYDVSIILTDAYSTGSGRSDLSVLVPVSYFEGLDPEETYLYLYSEFGFADPIPDATGKDPYDNDYDTDATFEEWRTQNAVKIVGTKFSDADADGEKDLGEGAPPASYTIELWVDTDGDGVLDETEDQLLQTTETEADGSFKFFGVKTGFTYFVKEADEDADFLTTQAYDTIVVSGSDDPGTIYYADPIGNRPLIPQVYIDKTADIDGEDECADATSETITYTVQVSLEDFDGIGPTSEESVSNLVVTDTFEDGTVVILDDGDDTLEAGEVARVGDTNGNDMLDAGEVWSYTYTRAVTQDDLDTNGIDGDGDLDNVADVSGQGATTGTSVDDDDDATVDVCVDPEFTAVKEIVSVSGGVELEGGDTGTTADDAVDSDGDTVTYRITITNTGNVTLNLVDVVDTFEGVDASIFDDFLESDTDDNVLQVGETWTYEWTETVTQEELDELCATDETITNSVAATFDFGEEGDPHYFTDTQGNEVETPVVCDPEFTAVKEIVSVSGGVELEGGDTGTTADDAVDSDGDTVTYRITITNTGNVTLNLVDVVDTFEGVDASIFDDFLESDTDDNVLQVGETWTYEWTETVTQEELDELCATDETITNSVAATFDFGEEGDPHYFTDTQGNEVETPVVCDPDVSIEKNVKTDYTSNVYVAADDLTKPQASTSTTVMFEVILINTGNITLTGVTLEDILDGANLDYNTINAGGEALVYADYDADGVWDIDGGTWSDLAGTDQVIDFDLAPDAIVKVYYQYESVLGNHVNVAEVTTDQGVSDENEAGYFVLPSEECVGVGTPGFWSNNGYVFWNGIAGDEAKHAGQPGFADGELLYAVDSDGSGVIDGADVAGLLVGDWNGDGIENNGEDTLFISLDAAQELINASNRQLTGKQADGVWILGRDTVASWLNYLANGGDDGQCFDDRYGAEGYSPEEALGDAIDWFQSLAIGSDDKISLNEIKTGAAVKTNSTTWKDGADDIHAALDEFNNFGTINGDEYCCDRDDPFALIAMAQVNDNTADLTQMTLIA
ncbi:hypothetical protein EKN06_09670 [Croceicoccus ponticola]|uniref:DUF7507 domain-containing protein n=1 Tax=Croceicoccus ponticola TaxID=2217664 RepID=A0A437GXM8_9SPHN|nr:hypothetical protein [Croceicoccus ponticola]RVQ67165.1 hypothetical protein EKN06_09670 [Croceicoccus ponticola]